MQWQSTVLMFILPLRNYFKHLLICLFAIYISLLVRCMFRYFAHFLIGFFVFLVLILRVLYVCWISVDIRHVFCRYFIPVCGLSFHSFIRIFSEQVFNFNEIQILFVSFVNLALVLYLSTTQEIQGHVDFSPIFSSRNFIVLHFSFKPIFHFELIFVKGIRSLSRFFFCFLLYMDSQFFKHNSLKRLYSLN